MHYRALRYALPCWLLLVCLAHVSRADSPAETGADKPDPTGQFFAKHCLACHGEQVAKADLRLDRLSRDFADPKAVEIWSKVWQRLHDGEMPPEDQPRPDAAESAAVLRWVADQTRVVTKRNGIRRLTRIEFENTLRDLFDLPALDVQEMLPPDGVSQGFDKVGDALGISHVQIAGYLEAVDEALDQATEVALQPARPAVAKTVFRPQYEYTWINRLTGGAVIPLAAGGADPGDL